MTTRIFRRLPAQSRFYRLLATAALVAIGMGFGLPARAEPFAPLADYAGVPDKHKNAYARSLENATPPEAAEVGVAQYPGARIVTIGDRVRVVGDQYQDIKVVRLYTVDPMDKVVDYFKAQEAGWVWRDQRTITGLVYPVRGASAPEDLPGNPKTLVTGPSISLSDIGWTGHPLQNEIKALLAMAPGSRTEIKIEYPGKASDLLSVTSKVIAAATERCMADETVRLAETTASQFPARMPQEERAQVLVHQASNTCKGIERDCTKGPKQVRCQQKLRRYGP